MHWRLKWVRENVIILRLDTWRDLDWMHETCLPRKFELIAWFKKRHNVFFYLLLIQFKTKDNSLKIRSSNKNFISLFSYLQLVLIMCIYSYLQNVKFMVMTKLSIKTINAQRVCFIPHADDFRSHGRSQSIPSGPS